MWILRTAGVAALAAVALSGATGLAGAEPAPPPTDPATPTAATPAPGDPAAAGAPKNVIDADGTYAIGTQLVPGVYTTAGPVGDGTCFWKRAGADGATLDNALSKKPQTVVIDATDQSFKTNGCQPWSLSDAAAPVPQVTSPIIAGLQLKAMMAQLNANAAASGQAPPP